MAWIYFQEVADSQKDSTSGSAPSLTVKSSQELSACSCPEWRAANCPAPRSGMTCGRCGGLQSHQWTSLPADSPARTSALRALGRAWAATEAALCLNTCALLASADRDSSSWKTSQPSLFGDSTPFCWDFMRWGMTRAGQLFQPQRWAQRTYEKESGYLPTPTTQDVSGRTNFTLTPGGRRQCNNGQTHSISLASMAVLGMLPNHPKGSLNPEYVEQAMGWPTGSTVCESWVMASSHFARRRRSCA